MMRQAATSGDLESLKNLIDNGGRRFTHCAEMAIYFNKREIVYYLIEECGAGSTFLYDNLIRYDDLDILDRVFDNVDDKSKHMIVRKSLILNRDNAYYTLKYAVDTHGIAHRDYLDYAAYFGDIELVEAIDSLI